MGQQLAAAYTPESPQVRRLISKGVNYLAGAQDHRLGGKCLIGLVRYKDGHGEDDARVADAVAACQAATGQTPEEIDEDIYNTAIAIIFLAELDAGKYRQEIEALLDSLYLRQKEGGGWGYPPEHKNGPTGDTSMTQYAVLALWTTHRQGIDVRMESVERVCNWLIRTQDPSGGWGYQGNDPGTNRRVRQQEVRLSICAAGLGSLYICGDILGLTSPAPARRKKQTGDLPPALKRVVEIVDGELAKRRSRGVDSAAWRGAANLGNQWFNQNYKVDAEVWPYYYLYAFERYQSFRELAEGDGDPEPDWYNLGVEYLAKKQTPNGSWISQGGAQVGTTFALLFLMRSTKRSIDRTTTLVDGRLTGGRGLPRNIADAEIRKGKIVSPRLGVSVADALEVLEDPEHPDFDALAGDDVDVRLSDEPIEQSRQVDRLRRLIKAGSHKARAAAVRTLARRRNLDDVPYLIFALEDPEAQVVRQADDGLRFISRRFDGAAVTQDADDPTMRAQKIESWKDWYRSIRPNAQFLP
jgi:hypothetical protein